MSSPTKEPEDAVSSRLHVDAGLTSRGAFYTDFHSGGRAPAGAAEPFTRSRGAVQVRGVVPAAPAGVLHKALLLSLAVGLLLLGVCS